MSQLSGSSDIANTPAILGESTADHAAGVEGKSKTWGGVMGHSETASGVYGSSQAGNGVHGQTEKGYGVFGQSTEGGAVVGISKKWIGVYGKTESTTGGYGAVGVMGEGALGGVIGKSTKWNGVYGETEGTEKEPAGVWGEHKGAGVGVKAKSKDGVGLVANSETNVAIHAETKSPTNATIAAYNLNSEGTGAAIYAKKMGNVGHAGFFHGNVAITGSLSVQGVDVDVASLLQRIIQLEQIITTHIQNSGGTGTGGGKSVSPHISAEVALSENGQNMLKINGSGFNINAKVEIDIVYYNVYNSPTGEKPVSTTTDNLGRFSTSWAVICPNDPSQKVSWDIQATEIVSKIKSNRTNASC